MTAFLEAAWHLRYVILVVAVMWVAASFAAGPVIGRAIHNSEDALEQEAADHGEPSRAQVEWHMQIDEIVDDETANVCFDAQLAALGIDRDELAVAFNQMRLQQRIDRIRDQIHENEVDRFRRDVDAWRGGAA